MSDDFVSSPFDAIRQYDKHGNEYWSARDLCKLLGYSTWQRFQSVIERAKIACENSGQATSAHFNIDIKMVKAGAAKKPKEDYHLSHYACNLIALNADPAKEIVAQAKTYFVVQTHHQGLITDEMKAINVNVASADVTTRLDTLEQKIDTIQEDTNRVTIQMEGTRADILRLSDSQADLRDRLQEHSEDLKTIKDTQKRHTEIFGQLMNFGEEMKSTQADHTQRFDRIETTMATKNDILALKAIQERQEQLLQAILNRLPPKP